MGQGAVFVVPSSFLLGINLIENSALELQTPGKKTRKIISLNLQRPVDSIAIAVHAI